MATSLRIDAILSNLADQLALRPGLTGVQVQSAYLADEMDADEFICFDGPHPIGGEWAAFGRLSRLETVTIVGAVVVRKPSAGELVVRAARARAQAIFAEIELYFVETKAQNRITVSSAATVETSKVRATGYRDGLDTAGRVAVLTFEIECETRLTAS